MKSKFVTYVLKPHLAAQRLVADQRGQAVVEAAFLLPVLLVGILLLVQPGIILYDRVVMSNAAAEGCRLLATCSADKVSQCESYVMRRLGSIPPQDFFHVHSGECSWDIQCSGGEHTDTVEITITNKVKPLPLIGLGAGFFQLTDADGYLSIVVSESVQVQPDWVSAEQFSAGSYGWAGEWTS